MKHHTIRISLEEITSLPDFARAADLLFERLNLDLRSDAMHNRKMAEVSCSFDSDTGFVIRYYSAPVSRPTERVTVFDPTEYEEAFTFRDTMTAGPDPSNRSIRERPAEVFRGDEPYTEEALARPIAVRPRRVAARSAAELPQPPPDHMWDTPVPRYSSGRATPEIFLDPYGQCALPEFITNDCGQVTNSPS